MILPQQHRPPCSPFVFPGAFALAPVSGGDQVFLGSSRAEITQGLDPAREEQDLPKVWMGWPWPKTSPPPPHAGERSPARLKVLNRLPEGPAVSTRKGEMGNWGPSPKSRFESVQSQTSSVALGKPFHDSELMSLSADGVRWSHASVEGGSGKGRAGARGDPCGGRGDWHGVSCK